MTCDLSTRSGIETLVTNFYAKVKCDSLIGPFFTEVAQVDWDAHIPMLCDFWESILLGTKGYKGNPLQAHQQLHKKASLGTEHFERWTQLFIETVDEHFSGTLAETAKQRALSIATVLQIKINTP